MDNCWQAEIIITLEGVDHVLRELTAAAQERIFASVGRGELTGAASADDFKET